MPLMLKPPPKDIKTKKKKKQSPNTPHTPRTKQLTINFNSSGLGSRRSDQEQKTAVFSWGFHPEIMMILDDFLKLFWGMVELPPRNIPYRILTTIVSIRAFLDMISKVVRT